MKPEQIIAKHSLPTITDSLQASLQSYAGLLPQGFVQGVELHLTALRIKDEEIKALVAVAEAAKNYCENFFGEPTKNEKLMIKALVKLAAIRNK